MNCEEAHRYCESLPHAESTFPFDDINLVMKVGGRMFALLPLDKPDIILVKCDPEKAIDLRERHSDIQPAWHMNKRHWNMMNLTTLSDNLIRELILHSYSLVVSKLPKKTKTELNLL